MAGKSSGTKFVMNSEFEKGKSISYNLSLKDFQTSRQNLKACLDLYGICIKENDEGSPSNDQNKIEYLKGFQKKL